MAITSYIQSIEVKREDSSTMVAPFHPSFCKTSKSMGATLAKHARPMASLWRDLIHSLARILQCHSCSLFHQFGAFFPNKKSASFHYQLSNERVPPNSMATVWCIHKYSSTLNTGQGDLCNAKVSGTLNYPTVQSCDPSHSAVRARLPYHVTINLDRSYRDLSHREVNHNWVGPV